MARQNLVELRRALGHPRPPLAEAPARPGNTCCSRARNLHLHRETDREILLHRQESHGAYSLRLLSARGGGGREGGQVVLGCQTPRCRVASTQMHTNSSTQHHCRHPTRSERGVGKDRLSH
jgi:hypothetical protein